MRYYFVVAISTEGLEWIEKQEIEFTEMVLAGNTGIILRRDHFELFCAKFELFIKTQELSEIDGVAQVTLTSAYNYRFHKHNHRGKVSGWNAGRRKPFSQVIRENFVSETGFDVCLKDPSLGLAYVAPIFGGPFNIWFGVQPAVDWQIEGVGSPSEVNELFGVDLERNVSLLSPTGVGIPIVDSCGVAVAELVENNLFVLADFVEGRVNGKYEILRRLLNEVIRVRNLSAEEHEEIVSNYFAECYAQAAATKFADALIATKQNLRAARDDEAELRRKYVQAIRRRVSLERAFQAAEKRVTVNNDEELERLREEFRIFSSKFERIWTIYVIEGVLRVFTKTLYMHNRHTKAYHVLGSMRIDAQMRGDKIGFFNLSRWLTYHESEDGRITPIRDRERGFHHPHIPNTGVPCWGNSSATFTEHMGLGRWGAFLNFALKVLQRGVDPVDGYGKKIKLYRVVGEGERR